MRRNTRIVNVGGVPVGGVSSVAIQSMTNTDTCDVEATVRQIHALEAAGCEIVRSTVPNMDAARAFRSIRDSISIPLVADVHFDYRLAIAAIENGADKIRYNPGNIGSAAKVAELAACAKAHGIPIRVGVNSGAVKKTMLAKYGGPTAECLYESAVNSVRLLESVGFYDIVLAIKASSVPVTVTAYRMAADALDYPLHLGVTEAGSGEDSLIKSAMGIGSLLVDGIGDTIRVSITGDPVQEVAAAKKILTAAGIRSFGAEIISCPTCGRCKTDTLSVIKRVKAAIPDGAKHIKIAVMGCAVNGPGEAREADIGIAFGTDNAVVFKNGEIVYSGEKNGIIERFITDAVLTAEGR